MSEVVVVVSAGGRYEFRVAEDEVSTVTEAEAQRWLDEEWRALGVEPVRPSGKVLLLDKVLGVARASGERRFADDPDWARSFARNVARLIGRPVVVVDVAEGRVG
jgi:hypothetical protein